MTLGGKSVLTPFDWSEHWLRRLPGGG